jgi:MFS family permease
MLEPESVAAELAAGVSVPTRHGEPENRRFAALHNPTFLRFWLAITLALAGLWVRITVQGYLIYDLSDDKFLLGLAGFVSAVPVLLLSPVVGVVVDRFERKRVLLATQTFMALCLFALATLDAIGVLTVTHILIIATLAGGASAFDWPARLSLVPNLVTDDELQSAVALNSAAFNGARIIGPVIGGALIGVIGTALCFYLSAFAFLPSILFLLTLTLDRRLPDQRPGESPLQNLLGGYRYIWQSSTLRSLLSVDLFPVMFGMSFFALLPAVTRDIYDTGSGGLGLVYAADGAGAFLGVMAIALLTGLRHRGRLVIVGVFLFAVLQIGFAAAPTLIIGMALIFLMGCVGSVYATLNDTLVQTVVDDEYRGRVMAVYSTFWGLTPIGYLEAGYVASHWGTQLAIGVNGVIVLLYVLALIRWNPQIRTLQ